MNMISATLLQRIIGMTTGMNAVFSYLPLKDEPDIGVCLRELMKRDVTVVVPKMIDNHILPVQLHSFDDCVAGRFSIMEPPHSLPFSPDKIDIFFIPGVLFDTQCNRKGHGYGYFDRFLADLKDTKPLVGVCYDKQVIEDLAPQPWDIPMDAVITEQRILLRKDSRFGQTLWNTHEKARHF